MDLKLKKDSASQPISISDMTREELELFVDIEKSFIEILMKDIQELTKMVNYMADRFNIKLEKEK